MQYDAEKLYRAIAKVIAEQKKSKDITYTDLCYGSDIPMSTYDYIMNAKTKASFYSIAKIIKALDMTFEDFGRLLDEQLPKNFMQE